MRNNLKNFALPWAVGWLVLATAGEGRAHSVYIYGWVEGGNLCTESYFGGDEKVRGGAVTMRNEAGEVLAETPTDEAGRACFPAPERAMALRFVVDAGQGHRAECAMTEAEVGAAVSAAPAKVEKANNAGEDAAPPAAAPFPPLDNDRLRALLRDELQAQLAPLRQTLAQATAPRRPGFREIVGGLGWIAGLAALAHFGLTRRKGETKTEDRA